MILPFWFIKIRDKEVIVVSNRPSWDEYFMGISDSVAKRATCDRGKSGSIIVRDKKILTTGYVGSPPGMPHCDDVGHLMREVIDEEGHKSMHCIRTLHAEENAILQAAEFGICLKGATLYCKMTPCYRCAMKIVRVGIVRVVAKRRYHADELSVKLFKDVKIQLDILEDKVEKYKNQ
jgi:dCMP deaminase